MLKRVYVWELPVRLTHWTNFLCIITLSITGYYIGNPFIHAVSESQYIMGWMRFIHFVAAYLFTVSIMLRTYWSFAGNKYANLKEFIYFPPKRFRSLLDEIRYYMFRTDVHTLAPGHNAFASAIYLGLWILFIAEIVTGFALYSQSHRSGIIWTVMGGWLLSLFSNQTIRLYHHLIMWLIIFFVIDHVYLAWFTDRANRGGFISSIFSGYKTLEE